MDKKNIGIVSLGLIGGSLLKALAKKNINIYAVTTNKETVNKTLEYTSNVSTDIDILKDCEIVFVCSPMSKTLEILDKLEKILKPSAIVADTCSLKEFVMKKERPYIFIGTHPMAGTEKSGFDASFDSLFEDANWVLTPSKSAEQKHIEFISDVISLTGAKPLVMDASEHDRAAAYISHMPMLVSQALMQTVMNDNNALKIASSGFRDMTRLSMSNTMMANDMITMNSENISEALISLIEHARGLLDDNYLQSIEKIKEFRASMYNDAGKNILD